MDEQYALKKASENGYKIYSVGINDSDSSYLKEISKDTTGKVYTPNKGSDLANFLSTKSGKEYPTLFWTEKHLENKTLITLGELLSFTDIGESNMEYRKIFFEATEKGTIIFWHRRNVLFI